MREKSRLTDGIRTPMSVPLTLPQLTPEISTNLLLQNFLPEDAVSATSPSHSANRYLLTSLSATGNNQQGKKMLFDRKHEELAGFGVFGILRESFRLFLATRATCNRLLLKTTLAFILPLATIAIVFSQLTHPLLLKLSSPKAEDPSAAAKQLAVLKILALYEIAFIIVATFLSVAANSAVTFVVGRMESDTSAGTPMAMLDVLRALPRIGRRMLATLLWWLLVVFGVSFLGIFALGLLEVLLSESRAMVIAIVAVFAVVLVVVFHYLAAVLDVAWAVSVFEEEKGIGAVKRGVELVKGKRRVAVGVKFVWILVTGGIRWILARWLFGGGLGTAGKVVLGAVTVSMASWVMLMKIMVEIVLYCVCKAYHCENIDVITVSNRLCGYSDGYVQLIPDDDAAVLKDEYAARV